jgi:hypothetical protein
MGYTSTFRSRGSTPLGRLHRLSTATSLIGITALSFFAAHAEPHTTASSGLVKIGKLDASFISIGHRAVEIINEHYSSGCLKEKFLSLNHISFENEVGLPVYNAEGAWDRLTREAPFSVDLLVGGGVLMYGYTYTYFDGEIAGSSEFRIWSNPRKIVDAVRYASHIVHELSHQARAGGFTHERVHQGSVPYSIQLALEKCVSGR